MITYLIVVVVIFFILLFAAAKLNSRYKFYSDHNGKIEVATIITLVSVCWVVTVPILSIIAFFAFVVLSSSKLLK